MVSFTVAVNQDLVIREGTRGRPPYGTRLRKTMTWCRLDAYLRPPPTSIVRALCVDLGDEPVRAGHVACSRARAAKQRQPIKFTITLAGKDASGGRPVKEKKKKRERCKRESLKIFGGSITQQAQDKLSLHQNLKIFRSLYTAWWVAAIPKHSRLLVKQLQRRKHTHMPNLQINNAIA